MTRWNARATAVAFAGACALAAAVAHAQVYKCVGADGKTVYADTPCGSGSAPMRLPEEPTRSSASPTACAQLKDEVDRLDAEAARNAARGRKETAAAAAQRRKVEDQYSKRCAGISRSVNPSK